MDKMQIGFSYPKNILEDSKSSIYSNNLPNYYIIFFISNQYIFS